MLAWDDDIHVHNVSITVSVQQRCVGRSASHKKHMVKDTRRSSTHKVNRPASSTPVPSSSASRATKKSTVRPCPSSTASPQSIVPVASNVVFPFKMHANNPINVGSDCTGLGSAIYALRLLGLRVKHKFACDVAKPSKMFIFNNCKPNVWYDDCMLRDNQKTPSVDVYVAGLSCQPSSSARKNKGINNKRGTVFDGIFDYIRHRTPTIFVLESAKNLLSSTQKSTFGSLVDLLRRPRCPEKPDRPMYWVTWDIYNSKDYGVPQNRERLYILGIRTSKTVGLNHERHNKKFKDMMKECVMETPRIRDFLGRMKLDNHQMVDELIKIDLRARKFKDTAKRNLRMALDRIHAAELDLSRTDIILDLASGFPRPHLTYNICPAITHNRCLSEKSFYLLSTAHVLTALDYVRLQGLDPYQLNLENLKSTEIGQLAGNSMTIPLLALVLRAALALTGLAKDSRSSTSTSNGSSMSPSSRSSVSTPNRSAM
jgi:DNA-cytosine methyltransferase